MALWLFKHLDKKAFLLFKQGCLRRINLSRGFSLLFCSLTYNEFYTNNHVKRDIRNQASLPGYSDHTALRHNALPRQVTGLRVLGDSLAGLPPPPACWWRWQRHRHRCATLSNSGWSLRVLATLCNLDVTCCNILDVPYGRRLKIVLQFYI